MEILKRILALVKPYRKQTIEMCIRDSAYITKPVSMDEVHRILRQYLGSRGANAAS